MKSSVKKERAVRIFLAALLKSDLSLDDIEELLTDIAKSPGFALNVVELIRHTMFQLRDTGPTKQIPYPTEQRSIEDLIYSAIQRRRLSKAEVLHMMNSKFQGGTEGRWMDQNATVRQLVSDFVSRSSESGIDELLRQIDPSANDDAYLRGITRKN